MSKFWQKKYISKYTGEEIDAAVAKADTVPAVTVEDAGSALVVNEEGKIVPGEAGGENYVVTTTLTVTSMEPLSFVGVADKTGSDIKSHLMAGEPVSCQLHVVMNDQIMGYYNGFVSCAGSMETIIFIYFEPGNIGTLTVYRLELDTTDESIVVDVFDLTSQS